jgi:hypothetical protein
VIITVFLVKQINMASSPVPGETGKGPNAREEEEAPFSFSASNEFMDGRFFFQESDARWTQFVDRIGDAPADTSVRPGGRSGDVAPEPPTRSEGTGRSGGHTSVRSRKSFPSHCELEDMASIQSGSSFPSIFEMGDMAETSIISKSASSLHASLRQIKSNMQPFFAEVRHSLVRTDISDNAAAANRSSDSDKMNRMRQKKRSLEDQLQAWRSGIGQGKPSRRQSTGSVSHVSEEPPSLVECEKPEGSDSSDVCSSHSRRGLTVLHERSERTHSNESQKVSLAERVYIASSPLPADQNRSRERRASMGFIPFTVSRNEEPPPEMGFGNSGTFEPFQESTGFDFGFGNADCRKGGRASLGAPAELHNVDLPMESSGFDSVFNKGACQESTSIERGSFKHVPRRASMGSVPEHCDARLPPRPPEHAPEPSAFHSPGQRRASMLESVSLMSPGSFISRLSDGIRGRIGVQSYPSHEGRRSSLGSGRLELLVREGSRSSLSLGRTNETSLTSLAVGSRRSSLSSIVKSVVYSSDASRLSVRSGRTEITSSDATSNTINGGLYSSDTSRVSTVSFRTGRHSSDMSWTGMPSSKVSLYSSSDASRSSPSSGKKDRLVRDGSRTSMGSFKTSLQSDNSQTSVASPRSVLQMREGNRTRKSLHIEGSCSSLTKDGPLARDESNSSTGSPKLVPGTKRAGSRRGSLTSEKPQSPVPSDKLAGGVSPHLTRRRTPASKRDISSSEGRRKERSQEGPKKASTIESEHMRKELLYSRGRVSRRRSLGTGKAENSVTPRSFRREESGTERKSLPKRDLMSREGSRHRKPEIGEGSYPMSPSWKLKTRTRRGSVKEGSSSSPGMGSGKPEIGEGSNPMSPSGTLKTRRRSFTKEGSSPRMARMGSGKPEIGEGSNPISPSEKLKTRRRGSIKEGSSPRMGSCKPEMGGGSFPMWQSGKKLKTIRRTFAKELISPRMVSGDKSLSSPLFSREERRPSMGRRREVGGSESKTGPSSERDLTRSAKRNTRRRASIGEPTTDDSSKPKRESRRRASVGSALENKVD